MSQSFKPIQIEKYQLIEPLASGGMAEVFRGKLVGAGNFSKHVAIKRILSNFTSDVSFRKMFEQEAQLGGTLSHANIVQSFDFIQEQDSYLLVMEFINGKNLRELLEKSKDLEIAVPSAFSLYVIHEVCKGLEYAHTKKNEAGDILRILHRDISPHNIMIAYDGGVKIVDFGLAKVKDGGNATQMGTIKGKFAYMSPEQANCFPLDARTDIFSAGLTLYELLTGQRAYRGKTEVQLLKAAQEAMIQPISEINHQISEELNGIVMRSLAPRAEERYSTATEFANTIQKYLYDQGMQVDQQMVARFMEKLFSAEIAESGKRLSMATPAITSSSYPSAPKRPTLVTTEKTTVAPLAVPIAKKEENTPIGFDQVFWMAKLIAITFFALLIYNKYGTAIKDLAIDIFGKKPVVEAQSPQNSRRSLSNQPPTNGN